MPYCPTCREEYRPEFAKCAECGVDLVAQLPPEAPWVEVFSGSFAQAQVVQAALEAAGIEAFVPKESIFPDAGIDVASSYLVEVLVHADEVKEAREVLAGMDRVDSDVPESPA
jgi:hypothetical protein